MRESRPPCRFVLWLAEGQPECGEPSVGVNHFGNPYCERHAPKCRHRRQTWWDVKLPCAQLGCYEGLDGERLQTSVPCERMSFRAATLPLTAGDVRRETALFHRNEFIDRAGLRWWQWNQIAGPLPPTPATMIHHVGAHGPRPMSGIEAVPQDAAEPTRPGEKG